MNNTQPKNEDIIRSMKNYHNKVNKRRKYLVSAHGRIPKTNTRFMVPDNVLILFLTPYDMTVDPLASNLIMLNWYQSMRAMRILERNNLTRRGRYNTLDDKPTAVERAYIAPPGLRANNLELHFPDWDNTSNNSHNWERNEMGIFSLPVRLGNLKSKNNSDQYRVPRLSSAFRNTPQIVTLKDIADQLSATGATGTGNKKGGILIIDACRATSSNSASYCRRTGCGDKSRNRSTKCNEARYEKEITKRFLNMLSLYPQHQTRLKRKQIDQKAYKNNNNTSSNNGSINYGPNNGSINYGPTKKKKLGNFFLRSPTHQVTTK